MPSNRVQRSSLSQSPRLGRPRVKLNQGIDWQACAPASGFDELLDASGRPRRVARGLLNYLDGLGLETLDARRQMADATIRDMGVSFVLYTEDGSIDRAWPLDLIPRTIPLGEWRQTAEGLRQRLKALNCFIEDIYNEQAVIADGVIPAAVIRESANFRPECVGMHPAHGVWAHICGTDLVRDGSGRFHVLEDNLRVPSGVAYMLENRAVIKRVLPECFECEEIKPVDDYPSRLFDTLVSISPRPLARPEIVVLTPGIHNSAYFEHAYLAQQLGVELVEGSDLRVGADDCVYMRTIAGPQRVDVIYRRIDDLFLDPEVFRQDSTLGVPGLMRAWRTGKVALANAPGAGVADDKAVYAYVPELIRYYLGEEPLLANVPTWLCADPEHQTEVLSRLSELVVKPVNESGGYGMLIGPHSTRRERQHFAELIRAHPRNYIAQPTLDLSTAPVLTGPAKVEPRHLDLRPFILQGAQSYVTTGGLTRVARARGSLVVNSSQGGGSKDTWIVEEN